MAREQYGQALAERAAALRKQQHVDQHRNTGKKSDALREVGSQDGNEPPRQGEPTHQKKARPEEEAPSGEVPTRERSSREKESRDAEPSSEKGSPPEERPPRREDASHKTESPYKENAGNETGPPREEGPGDREPSAPKEESPKRKKESPNTEEPPPIRPPANDTPAPRPKSIWKDATPHSWLVNEVEQPTEVAYTRVESHFGGAACGAVMGLVLRLMLRRYNYGEGGRKRGQQMTARFPLKRSVK